MYCYKCPVPLLIVPLSDSLFFLDSSICRIVLSLPNELAFSSLAILETLDYNINFSMCQLDSCLACLVSCQTKLYKLTVYPRKHRGRHQNCVSITSDS